MVEWQKVPWSVWTFVILTTTDSLVRAFTGPVPAGQAIFFVVFMLAWNFFLLRQVRWIWIGTALLLALFLGLALIDGSDPWYADTVALIELGLLLMPATHRFFGRPREVTPSDSRTAGAPSPFGSAENVPSSGKIHSSQ
jgi:hypothetical protein